ncbi:hypothetical protein [Noviherbaspirillum aerium]|uniref:hypothetical protein n=1 Tax=Noviherbaspirillum aerium TaxID=2588497 RepID=UPI00178C258D|nr:hypothetical protein [Noviherbaspirillum aerium]
MKLIADAVEYVFYAVFALICLSLLYTVSFILTCFFRSMDSMPRTAAATKHEPDARPNN